MKPVNKTRRTVAHSGVLGETRVYAKNESRIVRANVKRASRKADRVASKLMIRHIEKENECGHDQFELSVTVTGYERWKYCKSPRITISEFTSMPWWTLMGKVRYQDGFRTWYR